MSRPNKMVKCVVCGKEIHYSKTLKIEHQVRKGVVVTGRACRNHQETVNYKKFLKESCDQSNAFNIAISALQSLKTTQTENPFRSHLCRRDVIKKILSIFWKLTKSVW